MTKSLKNQMGRPLFKRSTIAACVMAATAIQAQAQETTEDDPALLEEVVVYGIKQSLQNAQNIKREAATVKDVITASDVSALPDKSVVEALSRVPGISIENFKASNDPEHFGAEGSAALIRGLTRVRTEFNGRSVFSARTSGGLNFSDVPPELVGSIEVIKNQTASTIEGGIAGTVNLITRKPFDSDGRVLGGSIKLNYGDIRESWTPEFSGVYSDRWETNLGEFGLLLNVSTSEFESRTEGVGFHNFYEKSTRVDPRVGDPIPTREDEVLYLPPTVQARFQETDRSRDGLATSLQWASPDETVLATFEYIRSDSKLSWHERVLENKDSQGSQLGNRNATVVAEFDGISGPDISFNSNNQFRHGVLNGPGYLALTRFRDETSLVNDLSLNLEFTPNDNLKVTTDFQYVDADSSIYDFVIHNFFNSDVYVDGRGDTPEIEFLGDNSQLLFGSVRGDRNTIADPSAVNIRSAMDHNSESEGEQMAFAGDAEYIFDDGFITAIKGGIRFSSKEQNHKETDYDWGLISPEWTGEEGTKQTCAEFPDLCETVSFGADFHGGGVLKGQNEFLFPRLALTRDATAFYNDLVERNIPDPTADDPFIPQAIKRDIDPLTGQPVDAKLLSPFQPNEIFRIEEERSAIYGQLDFAFGNVVRGNVGVRYISIDLESTGITRFDQLSGGWRTADGTVNTDNVIPGFIDLPAEAYQYSNGATQSSTLSPGTYTKALPSLNMVFNVTNDFLVRFGISQGVFVPELQDVKNSLVVKTTTETILQDQTQQASETNRIADVNIISYDASTTDDANPLLEPEESVNTDVSFEWYFAEVGSLTLALFNKDIENLIRVTSTSISIANQSNGETRLANFVANDNVGDATVSGYEVAYQQVFDMLPAPFDGLGLSGNYTYVDAEEKNVPDSDTSAFGVFNSLPLEGLSEHTFNASMFYENEVWSTRLAYNWRSEYLLNSRGEITKSPIYNEARGVLDYSFSYSITDSIKIGFDINNVLDEQTETLVQINEAGDLAPRNFFIQDRRYSLRITGNF